MTVEGIRGSSDRSVLVLTSLAGGPKHGYGLIKDIEGFAGVKLGPGTLYGCLAKLEQAGLVEALPAEDRRHPYRITASGLQAVRERLTESAASPNLGWAELQEPCHEQLAVSLAGGALPEGLAGALADEVGDLSAELLEAGETTRCTLAWSWQGRP